MGHRDSDVIRPVPKSAELPAGVLLSATLPPSLSSLAALTTTSTSDYSNMAPKYSKKKAKFTYAERKHCIHYPQRPLPSMLIATDAVDLGVLGALSEIQKDHRKHAVHMATLRAQSESEQSRSPGGLGADSSNRSPKDSRCT